MRTTHYHTGSTAPAPASTALDNIYDPDNIGLRDSEVVQENLDLLDTCPEDYLLYS
jgi:hypothetical protein